jgi:hypothetical protein
MNDGQDDAAATERTLELFTLLCDVVERAWQHWPVDPLESDNPMMQSHHSSDYASKAAKRVMDEMQALGLLSKVAWPLPRPTVSDRRAIEHYEERDEDEL